MSKFQKSLLLSLATAIISVSAYSQDYPYIAGGSQQTTGSCTPYSGCVSTENTPGSNIPYSHSDLNASAPKEVAIPECSEENLNFLDLNSLSLTTDDGTTVITRNPNRFASGFDYIKRETLDLIVDNCVDGIRLGYVSFVVEDSESITFRSNSKLLTITREELNKSSSLKNALNLARNYPKLAFQI